MKRTIIMVLTVVLLVCLLSVTASAAASASMSGPSTIRAGNTITVTFSVDGSGVLGMQGTLSYDSSILTLQKTEQKIGSPWVVEWNGNHFVAYDNNQKNPINKSTAIFAVTFQVNKNAATGASVKVSCTDLKVSDGGGDTVLGTATYTKEISRPLSTDNKLKGIYISNATLSPSFSAGTTSYQTEVPYSVSKLDITARASDSNAKVSINNPTLTPNGTTKVTITVTSESGSKRTYTISVKRAQDPNYVKSAENSLSAITVDGFLLSPAFTSENTNYMIWLPFETETVKVTGTPKDSKASVRTEGGETLLPGEDNEIKVICTAEDGTEKTYIVVAKRAAAHGEAPTEPTEPEPTVPETTVPETTEPETQPTTEPIVAPPDGPDKGTLLIIGVLILVAGFGLGIVVGRISRA